MCPCFPSLLLVSGACSNLELLQVSEQSAWINGDEVASDGKKTVVVPNNSVLEVCGLKFAVEHAPNSASASPTRSASSGENEADPDSGD